MKLYRNISTNIVCELVVIQGPKVRVMRDPLSGQFYNVTDDEWPQWELIVEEEV
jgi:hypothetical protein|tara:strand:+ start:176 stop:337 length:162 start_codon:yes stop_codon:yes gene_type:complete